MDSGLGEDDSATSFNFTLNGVRCADMDNCEDVSPVRDITDLVGDVAIPATQGPASPLGAAPYGYGPSKVADPDDWDALTVEQLLDTPLWTRPIEVLRFDSLGQFQALIGRCEDILETELIRHNYDTMTSLLQFYHDYSIADQACNGELPLVHFVSAYNKDLSKEEFGLSCVGLSVSLMKKLCAAFPNIGRSLAMVSCEEVVKDYGSYSIESPNAVKEHVLVAMRVNVAGRSGYVLFDPGYHVGRAIVIFEDRQAPHTGWFVQSKSDTVTKEYCYELIDEQFVSWTVRETRNNVPNQWSNLIYVKRAFARAITITQKRALFYSFKSLVVRDRDGPKAGLYCWMKSNAVTIFYPDGNERKQVKLPINKFGSDEMTNHLAKLAKYFQNKKLGGSALAFLQGIVGGLKTVLDDKEFVEDMLEIDDWVEEEA